jgi:hypothetical protein
VKVRTSINPYAIIAFGLTAWYAVVQQWSLPEFCWATWLGGLVYAWLCVATAAVQLLLAAGTFRGVCEQRLPFVQRIPPRLFPLIVVILTVAAALLAFRLYSYLFAFYGIFLSVFAEMQPHALFGRNGFINSDFYTPVMYLLERLWPLAVGIALANWSDLTGPQPWKRVFLPMDREIVRLHLFVLGLPFFSLISWALFGNAWQTPTIVLLLGVLYLVPKKSASIQAAKVTVEHM